jgi:hypothetical protein
MTRRVITIGILLAALAAIWHFRPSDQRRIRQAIDELADALQPAEADTEVSRVARLAPFSRYLAPDIRVQAPTPLHGRDQVLAAALQMSRVAAGVSLQIHGIHIDVAPTRESAVTTMGVTVAGLAPGGSEAWREITELRLELSRRDDVWLVTHVAAVRALNR